MQMFFNIKLLTNITNNEYGFLLNIKLYAFCGKFSQDITSIC